MGFRERSKWLSCDVRQSGNACDHLAATGDAKPASEQFSPLGWIVLFIALMEHSADSRQRGEREIQCIGCGRTEQSFATGGGTTFRVAFERHHRSRSVNRITAITVAKDMHHQMAKHSGITATEVFHFPRKQEKPAQADMAAQQIGVSRFIPTNQRFTERGRLLIGASARNGTVIKTIAQYAKKADESQQIDVKKYSDRETVLVFLAPLTSVGE